MRMKMSDHAADRVSSITDRGAKECSSRPRFRSVQISRAQYPYYHVLWSNLQTKIRRNQVARQLSIMSVALYVSSIVMPSNEYATDNNLLYKVQNTNIILVRTGPESSFSSTVYGY